MTSTPTPDTRSIGEQFYYRLPDSHRLIPWNEQDPEVRSAYNSAALAVFGQIKHESEEHEKQLSAVAFQWQETAASAQRSADTYHDWLTQIGLLMGPGAYLADDGSYQDHVLVAKVPELAEYAMDVARRMEAVMYVMLRELPLGFDLNQKHRPEQIVAAVVGHINFLEQEHSKFHSKWQEVESHNKLLMMELNETKRGWQTLSASVVRLLGYPAEEITVRTVDQMVESRMQELRIVEESNSSLVRQHQDEITLLRAELETAKGERDRAEQKLNGGLE